MPPQSLSSPVTDSVKKINEEVAVGEDLKFQERWWILENIVWVFFSIVLVCALLGLLGRGPLSRATRHNDSFVLDYERIARTGTPSMLEINFAPQALRQGRIQLFVSESLVKELGAQRIIPAPAETAIGNGGLTYTFPATQTPASVKFALQPDGPGVFHFSIGLPGEPAVQADVLVLP